MTVKAFERSALYEDSHKIVEWENELGIRQGRNIQLKSSVAPIVGSKLSDLTGGTTNVVRVTLQPPNPTPLITDLTAGEIRVRFTCDDGIPSNPSLDTLTSGTENLTIGIAGADSNNRLGDLTAGNIHIVITCTDLTTLTFDVAASDIVALSTAQGMQYDRFNTIDISSIQSLVSIEGKTIDSITVSVTPGFTASTPDLAMGGGTSGYMLRINGGNIGSTYHNMDNLSGGTDGPGLAHLVPTGGILGLRINLNSNVTPFNVITSLTAAKLAAAAIDQSQGGIATGQIYLCTSPTITPIVDISKLINRTIASMAVSAASPLWASTSQPIVNASSSFDFYYLEYLRLHTDLTATPFSNTMTDSFGINDDISIVFTLAPLSSPTVLTVPMTIADFQAVATQTFPLVWTADSGNASLNWDLSAINGKHVINILVTVTTAFVDGSGTIDLTYGNSSANFYWPKTGLGTITENTLGVQGVAGGTVDLSYDGTWNMAMTIVLVPIVPSTTFVDFPIDAATLQSLAIPQALASVSNQDVPLPFGGDLVWDTAILASWIGSTVINVTVLGTPTDYGPSPFDGTAFFYLSFLGIGNQGTIQPPIIIPFASTMMITVLPYYGMIYTNATMKCALNYPNGGWRISTTIPGIPGLPVAYTEPQCIRNRSRHSIIVVADTGFLPDYSYNKVWFWREYSHDGIHWTFIDKYLPLELMSMQLTTDSFLLAGSEYPDWLDLNTHPCTFRGITSYTDARRFKNETWEWVRFGMSLASEEGGQGPGPPIFATVMSRE